MNSRGQSAQLRIDIDEPLLARLHSFQKVVHGIIDEELSFDLYVQIVIMQGLEKMLGDVIPGDAKVLWDTIKTMAEEIPISYPSS